MKKLYIFISFVFFSLSLISCGDSGENSITENTISGTVNVDTQDSIKVNVVPSNSTAPVFEERKVETKVENGNLTIGKNVNIKKGRASDFPNNFPIIKDGVIYQNSNMQKYAFIIEENTSIKDIYDFYKSKLLILGYKDLTEFPEDTEIEELNTISSIFENDSEVIYININNSIPKVLVDSLNLKGNFIEVQYNEKINDLNNDEL